MSERSPKIIPLHPPQTVAPAASQHVSPVVSALPDLLKTLQPHQSVKVTESTDHDLAAGLIRQEYGVEMVYAPPPVSQSRQDPAGLGEWIVSRIRMLEREFAAERKVNAEVVDRLRGALTEQAKSAVLRERDLTRLLATTSRASQAVLAQLAIRRTIPLVELINRGVIGKAEFEAIARLYLERLIDFDGGVLSILPLGKQVAAELLLTTEKSEGEDVG